MKKQKGYGKVGGLAALSLFFAIVGGWLTHIVSCLMDGSWGFLIAGAIFAPIGIIHGWLIWFGIA